MNARLRDVVPAIFIGFLMNTVLSHAWVRSPACRCCAASCTARG